jgi:hypothetical protein
MTARVLVGDCLDVLPTLAIDSADAIVTDPPYGLAFMGKAWDHGVPGAPFWSAALHVAKPGAYLLAFGGTRTFHRLACAIEDAGWELQDTLSWLYGIDLFCGLGGWTEGLPREGFDVIGFDIERHVYGEHRYPAQLVLQDVRTLHGSQFRDATIIVASSPCQEFSYRAMPWKRAKALGPPELGMELFAQAARIQREACEAAGRYIPMIQENVRGAQPWVGRRSGTTAPTTCGATCRRSCRWRIAGREGARDGLERLGQARLQGRRFNDPRHASRERKGAQPRRPTAGSDGVKQSASAPRRAGSKDGSAPRRPAVRLEVLGPQSRLGPHREDPVPARAIHRPRLPRRPSHRGCMTSPAVLNALLKRLRKPEYDRAGNCLHARAHYVNLGSIGRDVCPDCHAIKWGEDWPVGKAAIEVPHV